MKNRLTRRQFLATAGAAASITSFGKSLFDIDTILAALADSRQAAPAPVVRIARNSAGVEVVHEDARGFIHQLALRGTPPPRRPRPPADPDLELGFPVQTPHTAGTSGEGFFALVGDIDGDPQLEILTTAQSTGPLYAWNHDGTLAPGWPVQQPAGASSAALLEDLPARRAVVAGSFGTAVQGQEAQIGVYSGSGGLLSGWPLVVWPTDVTSPPSASNVDTDSADEIFVGQEDFRIHAYRLTGAVLPGWPQYTPLGGQSRTTPAFADLDSDGRLEIVSVTSWVTGGPYLLAYHHDGTPVAGFPVNILSANVSFPVIGDVDGDGQLEIVVVMYLAGTYVLIYSPSGVLRRSIPVAGDGYRTRPPALADLDGDRIPEIVVKTADYLNVVRGNGSVFPGWPVFLGSDRWDDFSSPVVGDVDGDAAMEIVITTQQAGSSEFGDVRVYHANGTMHPRFPKPLNIGFSSVPAIADIDRDRRNEIIIIGFYWNGFEGFYDKCWAYDLGGGPHGRIEWAQLGGTPAHTGRYPAPAKTAAIGLYSPSASAFYIRNANSQGVASTTFAYGPAALGWVPLVGDWDGDAIETVGLYNPATGIWYLRNSNSTGVADLTFTYGPAGAGWTPVVGDWNGDGVDSVGLYNPATGIWYLRNSNSPGVADLTFTYGPAGAGWTPVVGDWNRDGIDTVGLYNPTTGIWYLRNSNSAGFANLAFAYGPAGAGWTPVVGNWNGDGIDTAGLYNPATGTWHLRNSNTTGVANLTFTYGPGGAGWIPLAGDWDGL